MEFKISISEDRKYVIVDIFKTITGKMQKEIIAESSEEGKAHGIKNVFVDVSKVTNAASILENYEFAYDETERLDFPKDAKIAIFVSPDDRSHDFIETLFKNAGYMCHIFHDNGSAIEWLK